MEPSSLVLVAIVGVWAAYLVPHWLRRREELAQSRTPDRFSTRLRVLQRRARSRSSHHSAHRSGSAVLMSPRIVVDVDGEPLYVPAAVPVAATTAAAVAEVTAVTLTEEITVDVAERPAKGVELAAALAGSHAAARRRAVLMLVLAALTAGAVAGVAQLGWPAWAVAPTAGLLVLHLLASRSAAIRSRERLAVLAEQARVVPVAARPVVRRPAAVAKPAAPAAAPAAPAATAPARPARRPAVAAGAETWDPIPVPAPTYTLKPAVFRPEPPPLDLPATPAAPAAPAAARTARPAAGARTLRPAAHPAAHPAARSAGRPAAERGALPRRAEEIERILALEPDPLGLTGRKAANG